MGSCLIHAGSDECLVTTQNERYFLERNDLHQMLPPLLQRLSESGVDDVRVVTGPGSFTIIRVCTLLLNSRQSINQHQLTFHTITKEQTYQRLREQGVTPRYSVLFIGQRKNARRYDHQTQSHEACPYTKLVDQEEEFLMDMVSHPAIDHEQIDRGRNGGPLIRRQDKQFAIHGAPWVQGEVVNPHYGVAPLTQ